MKHFIITTLLLLSALISRANDKLIFIKVEEPKTIYSLFENKGLTIHYYTDDYVIATLNNEAKIENKYIVLDEKAFSETENYFIVNPPADTKQTYREQVQKTGKILYGDEEILIMKQVDTQTTLMPTKNKAITISKNKAYLPSRSFSFPVITQVDAMIQNLTTMVKTDSIMTTLQHLQNYGTRAYDEPEAYQTQAWIQSKLE